MARTRVLIADNSRDFVYLLIQFLSKYREFEIVGIAYDGEQALEMIQQTKPDILLLDMIMPELDGMGAIRKIQQETNALKIIVISAIDISQLLDNDNGHKIDGYFVKPFVLNELLAVARELANNSTLVLAPSEVG